MSSQLSSKNPGNQLEAAEWIKKGDRLLGDKKFTEAAEVYTRAIQLQPNSAAHHSKLGNVFLKQKQFEAAEQCFQKAVKLNPESHLGLYGLAQVAAGREQWERAIELYQQLVELKPGFLAAVYQDWGVALSQVQRWEEAAETLRKAIELKNDSCLAYYQLGNALKRLEKWGDALTIYQQAVKFHPQEAGLYIELANIYEKIGDYQKGLKNYQQVIELEPQQPTWVYKKLADLLKRGARLSEAISIYKKALEFLPEVSSYYVDLAEEYLLENNIEQAVAIYDRAITPQPEAKIFLFMPYYKAKFPERQNEFIYCLEKNIQCDQIEKIYLLIDDDHEPELKSSKFEIIRISSRPTYLDWIELTEKFCPDGISVLSNTDIYFDESIAQLREVFSVNPKAFVALSRYEKKGTTQTLHKDPHWSQDVWAVSGQYYFSQSFKETLAIPLGIPRCDNKVAYLFAIRGFRLYNPCHQVKTVHVHETQLRNYDKHGDTTLLGGTAWVYPSTTVDEPSKLKIDVWTLNSTDITAIQTNYSLARRRNEQKENSKTLGIEVEQLLLNSHRANNILGLNSEWQYPAITEKYAYQMMSQSLAKKHSRQDIVYFAFPWATLIDKLRNNKVSATTTSLLKALRSFKPELKQFKRVVTVCQHIRMLEFEEIFHEIGITDIFWSHTSKSRNTLPSYANVLLHPFPLYPVQAINIGKDEAERKYLYSFVGARSNKHYLTDTRNKIIDYLADDDRGLIVVRDQWYYNKIVYDHQILGSKADNLIDEAAAEEFKQVMRQSIFALCPSGSGPNSIRLWEAIGFGTIPVILSDTYLPPGDLALWNEAAIICPEISETIKEIPNRLSILVKNEHLLQKKKNALRKIWDLYGPDCFVHDMLTIF